VFIFGRRDGTVMTRPRVVAICGSLRDESHTRKGLQHALDTAGATGGETELLDLREWDLPVYDADASDAGDAGAFYHSRA
jgi:NADPH-dependent FMN reductase.